ncbi:UDP-glycosyltransferase 91D1-like [Silene latifolia]|uniref:UDP-glycosyltransferase 91D1-like n=1 Tax=Silene latifolia TaxID=37657 RepID=UPI003D788974
MASENTKMLHIVMFPWLAFGHLLPFFHLSKYLASKGHHISFLSASRNLQRLPKIPHNLLPQLTLVPLPLPLVPGLPPTAAATTDTPSGKIPLLRKAYRGLQEHVFRFLEDSSRVDWIVHDLNPWIGSIADRFGIKKAFFITTNAWTISVVASPLDSLDEEGFFNNRPCIGGDDIDDNLLCRLRQAKKSLGNIDEVSEETGASIKNTDVILIRGCVELEAESLQLLETLQKKPVVPTGLMPVSHDDDHDSDTWQTIKGWLDKHRERSVLYVALGSEVSPRQDQITELAFGLELSGLSFFWALRRAEGSSVEIPDGFQERIQGRGLVWTKWAPQSRILAHDSVGAFLTHCGCSSVIEGVQFGRPLIMLPFVLDQVLNARILKEKQIGVEIEKAENDGSINRRSVAELVRLVVEDEAGSIYRAEVVKMSRVVADIGLQTQYFDKLEEFLRNNGPGPAHLSRNKIKLLVD